MWVDCEQAPQRGQLRALLASALTGLFMCQFRQLASQAGVKHYISAGVDPHTVMQWSGHRTLSMLLRYHIISLEDLRRAGKKASEYRGPEPVVKPLRRPAASTVTVRSRSAAEAV